MKLAIITLYIASALAAPLALQNEAKRTAVERDQIARAIQPAMDIVKSKRGISEVDVDEISQALYGAWPVPKRGISEVDVDEISQALYGAWPVPK